ncbi:MAG: hypothetical protein IKJ11_07495 [Clostridia bacterium]|nr:hypothetical protein [Clostridia bacterium]
MKAIIMERLNCSEKRAAVIEHDLKEITPALQPLLDRWLRDGHCEDATQYHGYSLNRLVSEMGMRFTGALLTLDWIIKEPEEALKALSEPIR